MEMENTTAERWLTAKREQIVEEGGIEVDLYVRSLSPPLGVRQRQEQILRQLQELQDAGIIDSVTVNLWGEGVCLCDICSGTSIATSMVDSIERFEQWADDQGDVSLPFEREQVDSAMLERTARDLVVPSLSLSVTAGTELTGVFPCTVADHPVSVTDFVESLTATVTNKSEATRNTDQVVQI